MMNISNRTRVRLKKKCPNISPEKWKMISVHRLQYRAYGSYVWLKKFSFCKEVVGTKNFDGGLKHVSTLLRLIEFKIRSQILFVLVILKRMQKVRQISSLIMKKKSCYFSQETFHFK